ncbi:hypothetical protein S7711_00491 [Stachybotrys chartarum IBT 7711]|uniref:Sister chromatid cohesion protein DCC1 n=1 Tax=Stachybotrys chartarum (strain CBS 109288 / IBT 7711) TaxID=1280523 RepID=A0A084B9V5_STACB|nr:hypothetical protein S7711_00491 [Stachybotrys chartarum IBT 7711]KFA53450.1 hypothetical protein S40293_03416 [Stachybotrys chartarum IBT 40293]KFA76042.1 hypothetical protein S40288_00398 [Stachybotrys chartarum IBT 40288]
MSSQNKGISLRHTPDNIGYRLIEIPAELQELLESSTPPILSIEASDTAAVLRTPNKAYSLRQKNTSNALMLLSPHNSSDSPEQTLAAISTIHETVELEEYREPEKKEAPKTKLSGKWHERFGKTR